MACRTVILYMILHKAAPARRRPPKNTNRIRYAADKNYMGGYRGEERIMFSNDGLIFVTYDHYETFFEITDEVGGEM